MKLIGVDVGGTFTDLVLSETERDLERVLRDVLDGYISAQTAARDCGVIITADLALDREATVRTRAGA